MSLFVTDFFVFESMTKYMRACTRNVTNTQFVFEKFPKQFKHYSQHIELFRNDSNQDKLCMSYKYLYVLYIKLCPKHYL